MADAAVPAWLAEVGRGWRARARGRPSLADCDGTRDRAAVTEAELDAAAAGLGMKLVTVRGGEAGLRGVGGGGGGLRV